MRNTRWAARAVGVGACLVAMSGVAMGADNAQPSGSYCSESGDSCLFLYDRGRTILAEMRLAERYTSSANWCVNPPGGRTICRTAPVRRAGQIYVARFSVPRRAGVYHSGYSRSVLPVRLRVAKRPLVERQCRPVSNRTGASTARAINMSCASARSIVARTAANLGDAPAGWTYINPAGCEGLIARDEDTRWSINNGYAFRPGRPAISVVIYAGCNS